MRRMPLSTAEDRNTVLLTDRLQDLLADGQLLRGAVDHAHRTGQIAAIDVRDADAPAVVQLLGTAARCAATAGPASGTAPAAGS